MWFKNAKLYSLTQSLSWQDDFLDDALDSGRFKPCGSQDLAKVGWVSPLGGDALFHVANGIYWLTLKKQERLLPAAVVNAELADKVAQIEAETGNKVGKKAQQDLKQEIIHRLLPQAFTKDTYTHGFVSLNDNLVVIDSSADGKAEVFLATLRKAVGTLPVVPLARQSVQHQLTDWLQSSLPENVELLEEAELRAASDDDSIIRCKNQELTSDEMLAHLEAGKTVHKLAIAWDETFQCMLQEDLAVKRIKFTDVIMEQNDDIPSDQRAAKLDADFALMSQEVLRFAKWLIATFDIELPQES